MRAWRLTLRSRAARSSSSNMLAVTSTFTRFRSFLHTYEPLLSSIAKGVTPYFLARAGFSEMMRSSAAAGPVGFRRSCSQFWSVFTLTPMKPAKSFWDNFVRSRIARTPVESMVNLREASCLPRKMAPPSRTLVSSSSNNTGFIQQGQDLARKNGGLDEFHVSALSAIGG